jgi:hypothetical protein
MLGQSCAPVLSFPSLLLPFLITGGSAAADSDFVFYVSNLSWNVNDDTLREVRLIFFWLPALSVFDLERPLNFFLCNMTSLSMIQAFGEYGQVVDVRLGLSLRLFGITMTAFSPLPARIISILSSMNSRS